MHEPKRAGDITTVLAVPKSPSESQGGPVLARVKALRVASTRPGRASALTRAARRALHALAAGTLRDCLADRRVVISRAAIEPRTFLRPISESTRAWLPSHHGRDHARVTIQTRSDHVAVHSANTTESGE